MARVGFSRNLHVAQMTNKKMFDIINLRERRAQLDDWEPSRATYVLGYRDGFRYHGGLESCSMFNSKSNAAKYLAKQVKPDENGELPTIMTWQEGKAATVAALTAHLESLGAKMELFDP